MAYFDDPDHVWEYLDLSLRRHLDSAFPRGGYGIAEMSLYTEMEPDDSFSIIIRKV